jgi:hypothetical protein
VERQPGHTLHFFFLHGSHEPAWTSIPFCLSLKSQQTGHAKLFEDRQESKSSISLGVSYRIHVGLCVDFISCVLLDAWSPGEKNRGGLLSPVIEFPVAFSTDMATRIIITRLSEA